MDTVVTLSDFLSVAVVLLDGSVSKEALIDSDEVISRALTAIYAPYGRAGNGIELYPDVESKAAVLEFTLIRMRPLPRVNIEAAHELMKVYLLRNGLDFDRTRSDIDPVELWKRIAASAGNSGTLEEVIRWVHECAVPDEW